MSSATISLLILAGAAVLFITEIIPLAVTAMSVAVVLTLTNVLDVQTAFSGLMDSTVILFAGMYVIGAGLFETGVAKIIGDQAARFARTEKLAIISVMIIGAGLSSILPNTGTTAVLLPIVLGISSAAGYRRSKLLMPLVFAAGLGGIITLVGTPPNMVVASQLNKAGLGTFGFMEFAIIGIPLTIIGIIYMVTIGYKLTPDGRADIETEKTEAQNKRTQKEVCRFKQWISVITLLGTVLVMMFQTKLGIPLHVAAVIGALILVVTGVLTEKQAYKAIDWTTIFLFAGMIPLATALDKTGGGRVITDLVISVIGRNASPYVLTSGLFILSCGLTQFMSNTATTTLLAPIGMAIAQDLGANPKPVLLAIAVAASCAFATPVATPPNTLVFGPGRYRFIDYIRVGLPLIVICWVVSIIIIPIWWPYF
ncbi:MAG: transporter [Firmicutes bacterium HGW-Firmicutes-12]|nr:MAG: transporter [Firmicutes bacterium HGW-Firmicutes-12]